MTVPKQKVFPTLLEEKETEAIEYIRAHKPKESYTVAYSGGKDSEVTLHLVQRSGVKFKTHYCNTTIDPPDILKHIRRYHPEVKILRGKRSFWQGILYAPRGNPKGLPLRTKRWCCDMLKKDPARKEGKHRIVGLRAEESAPRAKRPRTDKGKSIMFYKPIFYWSTEDIWNYIKKYDLPYLKLYDFRGCARVGCIVCPFQTNRNRLLMMTLYPRFYALLRRYCDKLFAARKVYFSEEGRFTNGEDLYNWWCSGLAEEEWKAKQKKLSPKYDICPFCDSEDMELKNGKVYCRNCREAQNDREV